MEKTVIPTKEIIEYILSQPSDKPVRMYQNKSTDKCGCVMVQYAKENLENFKNKIFECGFMGFFSDNRFEADCKLEQSIEKIIPRKYWRDVENFGDLQKFTNKKTRIYFGMSYLYTNQKQLREAFKDQFPELSFKKIPYGRNEKVYPCDTRCAWVDWIDSLSRDGQISEKLADRATL